MTKKIEYGQLRDQRRELESELSGIDAKLRQAIDGGKVEALDDLISRKRTLPKLFIAASIAETNTRREILRDEDEANMKRLAEAEAKRDELRDALVTLERQAAAELKAMAAAAQAAELRISELQLRISTARNDNGRCDAGYKAALAGVVL